MFQTCSNSQLLRRVLWISAEQTIGASLKHKNTQPLYIFNRVRVLHLNRLKERTWLHSFDLTGYPAGIAAAIQSVYLCETPAFHCSHVIYTEIRINHQTLIILPFSCFYDIWINFWFFFISVQCKGKGLA